MSCMFGEAKCLTFLVLRQRLESEKAAREKAEAERKNLEEEIARLKASQEKEARGIVCSYVYLNFCTPPAFQTQLH